MKKQKEFISVRQARRHNGILFISQHTTVLVMQQSITTNKVKQSGLPTLFFITMLSAGVVDGVVVLVNQIVNCDKGIALLF